MPDYEPEKKELASRDVVSRRMIEHILKGKGVKSPNGDHLWLDISILGREHIEKNLHDVQDISMTFNGIDPADEGEKGWMPVLPMQHYLHGFNRLGGNSVSEAVVAGMIVGEYFAAYCEKTHLNTNTFTIQNFLEAQENYLKEVLTYDGGLNIFDIKDRMRSIMQEKVGVFRNGKDLEDAVIELEELLKKTKEITVERKTIGNNPELNEAYRVPKMLKLALCVAKGALERTESRGAHYREDHTKRDDANWLNRTIATWTNPGDTMPTLSYEEIDISKMEMPPAFRGYGRKDSIVLNPLSERRAKEIEKIKETLGKVDRFKIQEELLDFDLPKDYKRKNERVGVGYA
jgi:fumarate reductase flavoprotein subunit